MNNIRKDMVIKQESIRTLKEEQDRENTANAQLKERSSYKVSLFTKADIENKYKSS